MTQHTTLVIARDGEDSQLVSVRHSPTSVPNGDVARRCTIDEPDWTVDDAVQKHGQQIVERLCNAHEGVKQAIENFLNTPGNDSHTLYLQFGSAADDVQYWETVCKSNSFFALSDDPELTIGRIPGNRTGERVPFARFQPPLRIMAFLSALDQPAKTEWLNLRAAAERSRAAGLDVELVLRVGEPELLLEIQTAIANDNLDFVTVKGIPRFPEDFKDDIQQTKPHLLHLFCHGISRSAGERFLRLATIPIWSARMLGDEPDKSERPLTLTSQHFSDLPAWLVTLNCCEGGKASEGVRSLAYELVADKGIPAVIGVLEEFRRTDAHELCRRLYPKILDIVAALQPGKDVKVYWPSVLASVRRFLSQAPPGNPRQDRRWALPILYVSEPLFTLILDSSGGEGDSGGGEGDSGGGAPDPDDSAAALTPEMLEKIQVVVDFLKKNPEAPEPLRRQIIDNTLSAVPQQFRPDIDGEFPGEFS